MSFNDICIIFIFNANDKTNIKHTVGNLLECGVEGLSLHPLLMVMDRRTPVHLALNSRQLP